MTVSHDVRDSFVELQPGPSPTECVAWFRFRSDLAVFAGHFPSRPILPAFVLIEAVRHAAQLSCGSDVHIRQILRAKFTSPVLPDELLRVSVSLSNSNASPCRGVIRRDTEIVAQVSVVLETA